MERRASSSTVVEVQDTYDSDLMEAEELPVEAAPGEADAQEQPAAPDAAPHPEERPWSGDSNLVSDGGPVSVEQGSVVSEMAGAVVSEIFRGEVVVETEAGAGAVGEEMLEVGGGAPGGGAAEGEGADVVRNDVITETKDMRQIDAAGGIVVEEEEEERLYEDQFEEAAGTSPPQEGGDAVGTTPAQEPEEPIDEPVAADVDEPEEPFDEPVDDEPFDDKPLSSASSEASADFVRLSPDQQTPKIPFLIADEVLQRRRSSAATSLARGLSSDESSIRKKSIGVVEEVVPSTKSRSKKIPTKTQSSRDVMVAASESTLFQEYELASEGVVRQVSTEKRSKIPRKVDSSRNVEAMAEKETKYGGQEFSGEEDSQTPFFCGRTFSSTKRKCSSH